MHGAYGHRGYGQQRPPLQKPGRMDRFIRRMAQPGDQSNESQSLIMNSASRRKATQVGEGRAAHVPKALMMLLAALAFAYLLQIATPLRVDHDSIEYLTVAASIADGRGFMLNGAPAFVPYGYPLLVAGLEQLGIA